MTREERNELVFLRRRIALGILIGILCFTISALIANAGKKAWNQALENMDRISYPHMTYKEWVDIHRPEYQNSGDAQYAYYKYAEEYYTAEYRDAKKKRIPYQVADSIFLLMGVACVMSLIWRFSQYYALTHEHEYDEYDEYDDEN